MPSPGRVSDPHILGRKPLDDEADFYGLTHPGLVRKENQDHFLVGSLRKYLDVHHTSLPGLDQNPVMGERLGYLAMVADGVGSSERGGEASRLAIEAATQYVAHSMGCYYAADSSNETAFHEALQEAATRCHETVLQQADAASGSGSMATTLTLWIGIWPWSYLLQVGDSRCYVFHRDRLVQRSRDQTLAETLVDQGVLTRADVADSQWSHVLSSSIGGSQTAPVVTRLKQAWKSVGLLCSDGLTKHVPDEQIAARLRHMTSAKQACEALLQDALDGGGSDNITIIVGRLLRKDSTD
ncbi:MAG: serine/threonine-protein phosphatase [Gemmatimonadota bacterium]|nr:MAG: serine/threonine-protein phosphatase [Gemmatimonadota bacterium]